MAIIRRESGSVRLTASYYGGVLHGVKSTWASDGIIELEKIRNWIDAAGYSGFHEVEIFSELDWWKRDPDEVLRTMRGRYLQT